MTVASLLSTLTMHLRSRMKRPCTTSSQVPIFYSSDDKKRPPSRLAQILLRRRSAFLIIFAALCVLSFLLSEESDLSLESISVYKKEEEHWPKIESFPRWTEEGISMRKLLETSRACLDGSDKTTEIQRVYVVNKDFELLVAKSPSQTVSFEARIPDMTSVMLVALQKLQKQRHLYEKFAQTIQQRGFLFVVNYEDTTFCCNKDNVPIFTLSAPIKCKNTLPIPTYDTIRQTTLRYFRTRLYNTIYPWPIKKRAAVWRGSPTGSAQYDENLRVKLCELASQRPNLINAKFNVATPWGSDVNTRLQGSHIPMYFFQLYRAIIDIDGNSWSGRFGSLLCMSSVVVKVQPNHVDYFYDELQPWVHYIPVKSDLSDLFAKVEYAVADENARQVRQIIWNANQWCLAKFRIESLADDVLRIWNNFMGFVDDEEEWNVESLLHEFDFEMEKTMTRGNH